MGLYDWQCVARGSWALDVSYALAAVLTIDDRRAWQQDLVQRYVQRLRDHGVAGAPSFEHAWLEVQNFVSQLADYRR